MAYNRDKIFQNIGKSIAKFNELEGQRDDLVTIMGEHMALLVDDEGEHDFEHDVHQSHIRELAAIDTARSRVVSNVKTYLLGGVATDLEVVTPTTVEEVLDALEDAMYKAGDTVKDKSVPPPETLPPSWRDARADIDNAGVGQSSIGDFHPQNIHDYPAMKFEFEVYDISGGVGAEKWSVKNDAERSLGTLTTAAWFESKKYGRKFKIEALTDYHESGDGAAQLSNWDLTTIAKSKGDEEDAGGDTDFYGVMYVKLYDVAGTRHVEIYKDTGRTIMVASGSRVGDGEITLAPQPGYTLAGTVDVAYTADDNDITLKYPFPFAVGDKYYYEESPVAPAGAKFQSFFVNELDYALPASDSPTVNEAWATWGP